MEDQTTTEADKAEPARLRSLLAAVAETETAVQTEVRRLRSAGVSWSRIGAAAGITRQSAWERWHLAETTDEEETAGRARHAATVLAHTGATEADASDITLVLRWSAEALTHALRRPDTHGQGINSYSALHDVAAALKHLAEAMPHLAEFAAHDGDHPDDELNRELATLPAALTAAAATLAWAGDNV